MAAADAPQPSPTSSTTSSYDPADCSSGLCSPSCPQWCSYFFGPPPPAFPDDSPESSSSARVSPIMIALITVLAAAFLLLTYYTFASKFCRRRRPRRPADDERHLQARLDSLVLHDSGAASAQIPAPNAGLDEQFIKSITMFNYTPGDGLVESTDCAVCLTEFRQDETLRLMPNCQHAFHPPCIDTWLRSHSNCPICRTSMVGPPPPPPPPLRRPAPSSTVAPSRSVARRGGDVVLTVDADRRNPVSAVGEASSDQRRPTAEKERGDG